ncbi:MAG: MarR family transcriptional regulator [Anaerolineaceae bacterium]|nr:MarR family transcriptional regulator [Anaerolineaceae bacterium]
MTTDPELIRKAEAIDEDLRFIRRAILQVYETEKNRAGLTPPQVNALYALTHSAVTHPEGMTLKELCEKMGLAQSTVSGIVDRLVRKKIVRRLVDYADRRCARIVLTEPVKNYLEKTAPLVRVGPLVGALQRANSDERRTILAGLSTLRRLLGENNPISEQDRSSEA